MNVVRKIQVLFFLSVSSNIMIFLHSWDHDIILGRRFVAMMVGNTSRCPRSDHISQEVSESRMNFCFGSFSTDVVSTSLTKLMNFFSFFYPLFFFRSFSARSLSNWLCLHLYQPCVKQTLYNDKTCSRVPLFQQSSQFIFSDRPYQHRLIGDSNRSYKNLNRNWIWAVPSTRYLPISASSLLFFFCPSCLCALAFHFCCSCLPWFFFHLTLHILISMA